MERKHENINAGDRCVKDAGVQTGMTSNIMALAVSRFANVGKSMKISSPIWDDVRPVSPSNALTTTQITHHVIASGRHTTNR
jgi:hypothetical protein